MSLRRPYGQRTCAVDLAPLLQAPLFMPNGIQGRGIPLIPRTRSSERSFAELVNYNGSKMSDSIVGIDVSKESLDAYCVRGQRKQGRTFANSPDGWKLVRAWLKAMGSKQAHVCMEATGRHSLGVALALHDSGHVVSVVNPAQIRDFARTKLGRNKTDKVDAALIREYAELFKPEPWTPPSPAMRRLCEQTCALASSGAGRSGRIASAAVSATAPRPVGRRDDRPFH